MTRPNFLIVGAMKAGTTTLYADLYTHPDIFLTSDKEPEGLRWCDTETGVARYERLFDRANGVTAIGEASTFYTKRPYADGLAARARTLLGPDVQIFYLVRDPIKRCISQYNHQVANGHEKLPLNEAIQKISDYVDFSRYDWQIAPWYAAFGKNNIHILNFETYISDRLTTVEKVCKVLGVDPSLLHIDPERSFNKTSGKRVARGLWRPIIGSRFYRDNVRHLLPQNLRDQLKFILPKARLAEKSVIDKNTQRYILSRLSEKDIKMWSQDFKNEMKNS